MPMVTPHAGVHLVVGYDDPRMWWPIQQLSATLTYHDATDDDGGSDTANATALVENTDPTIVSINVSPASAGVGEFLTCTAIANDADGGSPTITYAWSDGSLGTSRVVTSATGPGETLICTATANDGDGGIVTATASATVTNTDPVPTVSITPATGKVGDLLTCAPPPPTRWRYARHHLRIPPNGSTHTISADDAPVNTTTATATDSDGGTDRHRHQGREYDPVISSVVVSPASARSGGSSPAQRPPPCRWKPPASPTPGRWIDR